MSSHEQADLSRGVKDNAPPHNRPSHYSVERPQAGHSLNSAVQPPQVRASVVATSDCGVVLGDNGYVLQLFVIGTQSLTNGGYLATRSL